MSITASLIKELREKTGAGMSDCKKALEEADGNIEAAVSLLEEKGIIEKAETKTEEYKIQHYCTFSAGILSLIERDLTEEKTIKMLEKFIKKQNLKHDIHEIIDGKVIKFEVSGNSVSLYELEDEKAKDIIDAVKECSITSKNSLNRFVKDLPYHYISKKIAFLPEDFTDSNNYFESLAGEVIEFSSLYFGEDKLQWINDDLAAGNVKPGDDHAPREFIDHHDNLRDKMNRCAEKGIVFTIKLGDIVIK
jgi:hypothetical protein